ISVLRGGTVVIDGNEIHDTGSLAIPGSGLGVNVAQKSYAALVRNNIHNNRVVAILVHEESAARIGFIDVAGTPLPNRLENNGTYGLLVSRGSEARITGAFVNRNASGGILVERGSVLEVADNEISGNGGDGITAVEGSGVVFEIGAATVITPNRTD